MEAGLGDWPRLFSMFEKSLEEYPTSTLRTMSSLIASEIAKRDNGIIPNNLACGVCEHEIEGDRYIHPTNWTRGKGGINGKLLFDSHFQRYWHA